MSTAVKIILGIIVASVFAIGASNIYGEEFTVDVPFDYGDSGCTLTEGTLRLYNCYMQESPVETSDQYNVPSGEVTWDKENLVYVPADEFEAAAKAFCKADLTCPAGLFELEDGTIIDYDEIIAEGIALLAKPLEQEEPAYKCANDIALYQGGNIFDVPVEIWIDEDGIQQVRLYEDDRLKTDNFTSKEELAVEACFAQWKLEVSDNIAVRSIVPNEEDIFQYHADVASGEPPITQKIVNERANADNPIQPSIKNIICNGYYDHNYKKVMGCFDDEELENDSSLQPAMKEYDDNAYLYFKDVGDDKQLAKIKQDLREQFYRSQR